MLNDISGLPSWTKVRERLRETVGGWVCAVRNVGLGRCPCPCSVVRFAQGLGAKATQHTAATAPLSAPLPKHGTRPPTHHHYRPLLMGR